MTGAFDPHGFCKTTFLGSLGLLAGAATAYGRTSAESAMAQLADDLCVVEDRICEAEAELAELRAENAELEACLALAELDRSLAL